MSALGYAKKVPFVVALIENSKAFLESQGEYISENEKRILRRVIRLSRIEDSSIRIQYLDKRSNRCWKENGASNQQNEKPR